MNEKEIAKLKSSIIKKLAIRLKDIDTTNGWVNLNVALKNAGITPAERVVVLMLLEDK